MIRSMLWPLIKKYRGMFIAMVALSMLGMSMMMGMQSALLCLKDTYSQYKQEYGLADVTVMTDAGNRDRFDAIKDLDCVDDADTRLFINAYIDTGKGSTSTALLCTYSDDDFYKRFVRESDYSSELPGISVEQRYADSNGIHAGDTVEMSVYGVSFDVHVDELVSTPETIHVAFSPYVMADAKNLGYVYVSEETACEIYDVIKRENFALYIFNASDPVFDNGTLNYANQVLVKAADGYTQQEVMDACAAVIPQNVRVISASTGENSASEMYMDSCINSLQVAVDFLPAVFYIITLVVITLFMGQIILNMTHDIGVMSAVGIAKTSVLKVLSAFAVVISVAATCVSVPFGYFLLDVPCSSFEEVYYIIDIPRQFIPQAVALAVAIIFAVGQGAVLLTAGGLFRITPKDAMASQSMHKKKLPAGLDRVLSAMSVSIKISISFMIQNPRRVLVSVFSVAASVIIVCLALTFNISKNYVVDQQFERTEPCIELVYSGNSGERFFTQLSGVDGIENIEKIYTASLNTEGLDGEVCVKGVDKDSDYVHIPDETGRGETFISDNGVVLTLKHAEKLGVTEGDTVVINGRELEITSLSNSYMHYEEYMSYDQFLDVTDSYSYIFCVTASDMDAVYSFLKSQDDICIIVDTVVCGEQLQLQYDPLNVFIYLIIGIGLFMSAIIITIMTQSALTDERRTLSVMRACGFTIHNISVLWIIQHALNFVMGIAVGLPLAMYLEDTLFSSASVDAMYFPFVEDPVYYVLIVLFVGAVIAVAHYLSMHTVRRWNIADNVRSRE